MASVTNNSQEFSLTNPAAEKSPSVGTLGDKQVAKEKACTSLTGAKVAKIAIYTFAAIVFLAGLTVATMAGLTGKYLLILPAVLYLAHAGLIAYIGSKVKDYENPKEIEAMRQAAAKNPSMEALVLEHGLENLKKYEIVPQERIDGYIRMQEALNDEKGSYRDELHSKFPLAEWREHLSALNQCVKTQAIYEVTKAREQIARNNNIDSHLSLYPTQWPEAARNEYFAERLAIDSKETSALRKIQNLFRDLNCNSGFFRPGKVDKQNKADQAAIEVLKKEYKQRFELIKQGKTVAPRVFDAPESLADGFPAIEARVDLMRAAFASLPA